MIFVHPDGTGIAHWTAARYLAVGPDGQLAWDRLPHVALYRGHLADSLSGTSHGGATAHAYGARVSWNSYGLDAGEPIDGGSRLSLAQRALDAGLRVGLVNSGTVTEPGSAAFLAKVRSRKDHAEIARQLVESKAHVILGGGERYFLPQGVAGVHGPGAREDGLDLIARARALGYAVVRTREELAALPAATERVLGLFAAGHTFFDRGEEDLRAAGLPFYDEDAPDVAAMTAGALRILGRDGARFLLVIEEEGSDNFGNANNARGTIEATIRADRAIATARAFVAERADTLLLVAADSEAGGLETIGVPVVLPGREGEPLPARASNGAPLDGREGTGTPPFLALPDRNGRRLAFAVAWSTNDDTTGGILVRAEGHRAQLVNGALENTGVHDVMAAVLFPE